MVDYIRKNAVLKIFKTLQVLKEKNLSYDSDKLLLEIMSEYSCSRRTAQEYLSTAEYLFDKGIEEYKQTQISAEVNSAVKEPSSEAS